MVVNTRHKIKCVGAPFDINFSSCSNIKPDFDWSEQEGEVLVHIDRAIFQIPDRSYSKDKTFAWLCESRFITPDVYDFVLKHYKQLFKNVYNKIFTCDSSLLALDSNFIFTPPGSNYPWIPEDKWNVYTKTKLCSMFCSTKLLTEGHRLRHDIASQAIKCGYDVYGGAFNTKNTKTDPQNPWKTKLEGLKDYMFHIVVENGNYDYYNTEKIMDCFATGTVPVYYGSKKFLEGKFNIEGIIFIDEKNYLEKINNINKETYNQLFDILTENYHHLQKLDPVDNFIFKNI